MLFDRRYFNVNFTINSIANAPDDNPTAGTQYIIGSTPTGAFAGATENYIARYNGTNWEFFAPKVGSLELFNLDTSEFLKYNGTEWETIANLGEASVSVDEIISEVHTLTATNITNQSVTLANSIKTGKENQVLLFAAGLVQIAGTDFTASGNTISWQNKGLANRNLVNGDTIIIQYINSSGVFAQSKTVTPNDTTQTILPDNNYNYLSSVQVNAIPYNEIQNNAGGITVIIGNI